MSLNRVLHFLDERDLSNTTPILEYFECDYLSPELQRVLSPFYCLAKFLERELPDSEEKTLALKKLLDARDLVLLASLLSE